MSCTHIYSASKVFTLPAICCEILSRTGIVIGAGQESGANSFLDVDRRYLVRQKEPMEEKTPSTQTYAALLSSIKERIQSAQVRAALAVNRELVLLYWGIGKEILARQNEEGWGTKVIERLAKDLRSAFPQMKGFSRTNLLYMRAFSEAWPEEAIVQQVVGQIPWGHNVRLLDPSRRSLTRACLASSSASIAKARETVGYPSRKSSIVSPPSR